MPIRQAASVLSRVGAAMAALILVLILALWLPGVLYRQSG